MTLETAKRIVLEQGDTACKEARAVVRGGMTICELTPDGRRTYPWIKVFPTESDKQSSIEQALAKRRGQRRLSDNQKQTQEEIVVSPSVVTEKVVARPPMDEVAPIEKQPFSIGKLLLNMKNKFREFMIVLDEVVVE